MFGSVVLDVAIGMSFVYLLMSLIASVLQEMLAASLQLRSANLLRGIRSLFSGDSLFGKDLVDALYTHGLIRGLYSDPKEDMKVRLPAGAVDFAAPAGTPATGAATATSTRPPAVSKPAGKLKSALRNSALGIKFETEVRGIYDQSLLPAYIPARTFGIAMIDILNDRRATGGDVMPSIIESLKGSDNKAGQAIYAIALSAQGDITKFQTGLENWYNDAMDRVSGWYKRHIQRILFVIGLSLAVFFNVDSTRVAQTLWHDRDARQAMASAASEYIKKHPDTASTANGAPSNPNDMQQQLSDTVGAFDTVTNTSLLPVGWKVPPPEYLDRFRLFTEKPYAYPSTVKVVGNTLWRGVILLFGWIVTGLAISLGAPFWFDTLNKFMVVRSTIKPQEKSQTDPSKDN